MNGREVKSDLDCADCLCAVCARSAHTSMDSEQLSYYDKDCIPCDCCYIGCELIEVEDDCPHGFMPDTEDYEREV